MCGRYAFDAPQEALERHFAIRPPTPVITPSKEIFPSELIPVVGLRAGGADHGLTLMRWNYVPRWAERAKSPMKPVINAKAETVASLPYFKDSFKHRRCLIPATSFYEWQKLGSRKTKFRIRVNNWPMFAFAGVWDKYNGENVVCVLTVPANTAVMPVHDRMPAIVKVENYDRWLSQETDVNDLAWTLAPMPSERMDVAELSDDRTDPTPSLF